MSSKLKGDLAPKPNKTPYELRLEILHLAQHIVERRADNELAVLHLQSDSDKYAELTGVLGEDLVSFKNSSVDEVLNIAKKLNDFVSNG